MSGYSSDGQATLFISPSESNTGLQGDEDDSSFSWGEDGHTMSHVAEQKPSLLKLKIRLPAQTATPRQSSHPQPEVEVDQSDDDMPSPKRLVQWAAEHSARELEPLHGVELLSRQKQGCHERSCSQDDSDRETSSGDEEPAVVQKKRGRPPKGHHIEPETFDEPPPKRPRGRPRKPVEKPRRSTHKHFSIAVYVEIAVPPKFRPGKTPRGNKVEKQDPRTEGPFTLRRTTTWDEFLEEVSAAAQVGQENLTVDGMAWGFQKKGKLPLNNEVGYHAMIQQIKAQKDLSALIVVVALPLPRMPQTKHQMEEAAPVVERHGQDDETLWGQKLSLDQQLAPIIEQLEETHQIGKCELHPELRCYVQRGSNWHFDLDTNRLQVWANAILRKSTSFDRAPIGSNFFRPKGRLGYKNEAPQTPTPLFSHSGPHSPWSPYHTMMPSPHTPPTFFPYGGMAGPDYPPMPWGYPPPAVQPHAPASISSSVHMPSVIPTPSSAPSQLTIEEWCNKHNLGDEACQGLAKLGFRVGDKLDVLDKDTWAWAGLGPLHQQSILAAYSAEKGA